MVKPGAYIIGADEKEKLPEKAPVSGVFDQDPIPVKTYKTADTDTVVLIETTRKGRCCSRRGKCVILATTAILILGIGIACAALYFYTGGADCNKKSGKGDLGKRIGEDLDDGLKEIDGFFERMEKNKPHRGHGGRKDSSSSEEVDGDDIDNDEDDDGHGRPHHPHPHGPHGDHDHDGRHGDHDGHHMDHDGEHGRDDDQEEREMIDEGGLLPAEP